LWSTVAGNVPGSLGRIADGRAMSSSSDGRPTFATGPPHFPRKIALEALGWQNTTELLRL